MAKRVNEELISADDASRAAKRAKKEKKLRAATSDASAENLINGDSRQEDSEETNTTDTLSKAEKKALKRAKKEQARSLTAQGAAQNVVNGSGDTDAAAKAERKARKHAEKAHRKAEKAAQSNGSTQGTPDDATETNGITVTPSSRSELVDVAYREHQELTALPQGDIESFIAEKLLTVEDALKQSFRPIISFKHLPVDCERAPFASFSAPTPIQSACWPYLLAGRDLVGVAETGSGKTLAFGVPCVRYIARLGKKERKGIRACVVSPTRELAMQIYEQFTKLAGPAGLKVACVYGGVSKDAQREILQAANIIVATPGRLNDFIQEGSVDLSSVNYLVLDEADRMLDKGFEEEVRKIISTTASTGRQTLMFTATWPPSVRDLASTFMDNPVRVTIGDNASGELRANTRIVQEVQVIEDREKQGRLIELLKQYQSGKNRKDRILVFCLYKKEATRIEDFIRRKGFPVAGIHGDLSQQKRTESLEAFKQGKVPLLVATDVAARGLDIPAVKVVINVTFPLTVEDYVHRIGRTGRAGQDGRAVTLFTQNEKALSGALINVLKAANQPVPEELMKFGTTVKKKSHDAYGAFYRDTSGQEMKKATKITFD